MLTKKMKKDWTGNTHAVMKTTGASNHSDNDRETMDYYATEPKAVRLLLEMESFSNKIWECACGEMHLSDEIAKQGKTVFSTDIVKRTDRIDRELDFIGIENNIAWDGDIITNPPYVYANQFILKALQILKTGGKLAVLLPIRYLEGKERKQIYLHHPPKTVYVSSGRLSCAINGNFDQQSGNAVSYAWFVWEKGFKGTTELKWFN